MNVKLVITDIDGVWTDGGIYADEWGHEWKKFNTADSVGVLFCQLNGIPVAVMTGENTPVVAHRAHQLNIEHILLGASDKLAEARSLCATLGIQLEEVAFIGDNINDIGLLREVGYPATVPGAPPYVKRHARYVTRIRGGEGAFRDFVEHLLEKHDRLEATLERYLEDHA